METGMSNNAPEEEKRVASNLLELLKMPEPPPLEEEIQINEEYKDFSIEVIWIKARSRKMGEATIYGQIGNIAHVVTDAGRGDPKKGWSYKLDDWNMSIDQITKQYLYTFRMVICNNSGRESIGREFETLLPKLENQAEKQDWKIYSVDGNASYLRLETNLEDNLKVTIPSDWRDMFGHIYERDEQIDLLMDSLRIAIDTDFTKRFHTVLWGPPAGGKTEIVRVFREMLGPDAVLEYDATATTQAGAIADLKNRESVPKVLIVEEIEKTDDNSLRWMLGVLDHRGEIRKVTAREFVQRDIKLLCIATVNDMEGFKKVMSGALFSRFTNKIKCPRPSPAVLRKVLTREVTSINGNLEWVEPAIQYAIEEKINDPRQVTAICLCGRDNLLDGSYQKRLRICSGLKKHGHLKDDRIRAELQEIDADPIIDADFKEIKEVAKIKIKKQKKVSE